jgi:hypothetical protein
MIKQGSWWVLSNFDPRWNGQGTAMVGMFGCPQEATDHIKKIKEELGEDEPKDLEFGYMKD